VTIRRSDGSDVTVKAKYVVGCDGAHSTVRESIGCKPQGEGHDKAWGVMDVLAVTDFPDIRSKCSIQSAASGNILLIPREGGYLFRLYVDMVRSLPTPGSRRMRSWRRPVASWRHTRSTSARPRGSRFTGSATR
jgi:phenol 2-monooxygenase (NADPH)